MSRDHRTLADKLGYLRRVTAPAGRGPFTCAEVAAGTGLSESYVKYLCNGSKTNPSMETITQLARFFGITDVRYFFEDSDSDSDSDSDAVARVGQQLETLELLAALRQHNVTAVATRLGSLSQADLRLLHQAVNEQLGRDSDQTPPPGSQR